MQAMGCTHLTTQERKMSNAKERLKLDLDDLRVESFETTLDAAEGEGTVFGQTTNHCGGTSSYCHMFPNPTSCANICAD